ncbi:MAG: hypothetical protein ACRDF4_07360, partial [Rhabdochlamydiaceae bacterium]
MNAALSFLERAASPGRNSSFAYTIADKYNPRKAQRLISLVAAVMKENPGFNGRYITDIQNENVEYVRKIIETGVEVRHFEGNKISFSVSSTEFLNRYRENAVQTNDEDSGSLVWCNIPGLVSQMRDMFQILWDQSISSGARIKQIEEGTIIEETRLITSKEETLKLGAQMVDDCQSEALYVLASENVLERNLPIFQRLADLQSKRDFSIKILAPLPN